jgi:competence protein ComEA
MSNDPNKQLPRRARTARLLSDSEQLTLAVLVAAAVVVIGSVHAWRVWHRQGVVDVDTSPGRSVEFRIDVNRADWPEFTLLPGVGETLARRIVDSRRAEGEFRTHEDLCRVAGIGPVRLEAIRPYLLPLEQAAP